MPERICLAWQNPFLQVVRHEVWSDLEGVPRQRLRAAEAERMLASRQANAVTDAP